MSDFDNRPVHVDFPSEMKVHSPKTDQQLEGIKKSFVSLFELIQRNSNTVIEQIGPLREMPEMFKDLELTIRNQFELSFLHQFESVIMSHQAEILADESKVAALRSFLEKKQIQLTESVDNVKNRYKKLLTQVAENNAERRKKLDNHAYTLVTDVFPREIEEKFSNISLPAFSYLSAHASECAQARSVGMAEGFNKAKNKVAEFLINNDKTETRLQDLVHDSIEPGKYVLSYYVAEVEDINTGEKRYEIINTNGDEEVPEEIYHLLCEKIEKKLVGTEKQPVQKKDIDIFCDILEGQYNVCSDEIKRFRDDNSNILK